MPPTSSNTNRRRIGLSNLCRTPNWSIYVFLTEYFRNINDIRKILSININGCIFQLHYAELLNPNNASTVLGQEEPVQGLSLDRKSLDRKPVQGQSLDGFVLGRVFLLEKVSSHYFILKSSPRLETERLKELVKFIYQEYYLNPRRT